MIYEEKAKNVKLIFELYLNGQSVVGIIKELAKRKILSPTGKGKWCKRTIDVMLSNEKYTGNVELLKSSKSEIHYLASGNSILRQLYCLHCHHFDCMYQGTFLLKEYEKNVIP